MPAGNEMNHVLNGLTVQGGFAIEGRPGVTDYIGSDMKIQPAMGNVVWTVDPRIAGTLGTTSANLAHGGRVTIPRGGALVDLSWYCGVASGNFDAGVYDSDATTLTKLYSAGSTANGATGWVSVQPNLVVTAGQSLFFAWVPDNGTSTRSIQLTVNSGHSNLPASFFNAPNQTTRLSWTNATSFPLPATLTVASLTNTTSTILMIARVV